MTNDLLLWEIAAIYLLCHKEKALPFPDNVPCCFSYRKTSSRSRSLKHSNATVIAWVGLTVFFSFPRYTAEDVYLPFDRHNLGQKNFNRNLTFPLVMVLIFFNWLTIRTEFCKQASFVFLNCFFSNYINLYHPKYFLCDAYSVSKRISLTKNVKYFLFFKKIKVILQVTFFSWVFR